MGNLGDKFRLVRTAITTVVVVVTMALAFPGLGMAHGGAPEPVIQSGAMAGVSRALTLGGALAIAGICFFARLVWSPVVGHSPGLGRRILFGPGGCSAVAVLLGAALKPGGPGWRELVGTTLALVLVAAAWRLTSVLQTWKVGAIFGLCAALLLTNALVKHPPAPGHWGPLFTDWLHLTAASVWMGGLLGFAFLAWPQATALQEAVRRRLMSDAVRRFSPFAITAVLVLVTTGMLALTANLPGVAAMILTTYGKTLTLKLALVVPLLALGGYNLLRGGGGQFRRAVTAEAILALVIATVAGFLAVAPAPAQQLADGGAAVAHEHLHQLTSFHADVVDLPPAVVPAGESTWLEVRFSEALSPSTGLRVVNEHGVRVHPGFGAPKWGDAATWTLRLPGLTPGNYRLEWDALSTWSGSQVWGRQSFVVKNSLHGDDHGDAAVGGHGSHQTGSQVDLQPGQPIARSVEEVDPQLSVPTRADFVRTAARWLGTCFFIMLAGILLAATRGERSDARRIGLLALACHLGDGLLAWGAALQAPFGIPSGAGQAVLALGIYAGIWTAELVIGLSLVIFVRKRQFRVKAVSVYGAMLLVVARAVSTPLPFGPKWASIALTAILGLAAVVTVSAWCTMSGAPKTKKRYGDPRLLSFRISNRFMKKEESAR